MDIPKRLTRTTDKLQAFKFSESGIVVWILVVGIIFSVLSDRFLDINNILNIFYPGFIHWILAVSMTAVIISGMVASTFLSVASWE